LRRSASRAGTQTSPPRFESKLTVVGRVAGLHPPFRQTSDSLLRSSPLFHPSSPRGNGVEAHYGALALKRCAPALCLLFACSFACSFPAPGIRKSHKPLEVFNIFWRLRLDPCIFLKLPVFPGFIRGETGSQWTASTATESVSAALFAVETDDGQAPDG
jgi:hypothetical protein